MSASSRPIALFSALLAHWPGMSPGPGQARSDVPVMRQVILLGAAAAVMLLVAIACVDPRALLPALLLPPLVLGAIAVLRAPAETTAAWLVLAATTPEMWLGMLLPGTEPVIIGVVKAFGLALVAVAMWRWGARFDVANPGLAFAASFLIGLCNGLLPMLSVAESLRTLIGSAAAYAFGFCRLSNAWCRAVVAATIWAAPVNVGFGALLTALRLYPMLSQEGGTRLEGSALPAFLAGFAMVGCYASVVELFREGRGRTQLALGLNVLILLATGSRSPLFCVLLVAGVAFVFLPSPAFTHRRRIPAMLLGGLLVAAGLVIASQGTDLRLLQVLSADADNLSNRDLIWPYFERAFDASPWLGWGVGAGKLIVDPDSELAHLLGTTAAHNEYLRIGVESGYVGLALLFLSMIVWCLLGTRPLWRSEAWIVRLVMLAFAIQSMTDNTLIAATATAEFVWLSAVFARGRLRREENFRAVQLAHLPGRV